MRGEPSHGAYPHRGRDPVLAVAEVGGGAVRALGRRIDPLHAATLTVGVLEAGSAENVIPASASARGALRAHREEDRAALRSLVEEVARGVAQAHGCSASVAIVAGEPPLENDPAITSARARAARTRGPALCAAVALVRLRRLLVLRRRSRPSRWRSWGCDGAEGFSERPLHHPELLPPDAAVGAVARAQAVLFAAAVAAGSDGAP